MGEIAGGVRAFIVARDVVCKVDMVPDVAPEEMAKARTLAEATELEMRADWVRPEYGPVTITVTLQVAGDPGFLLDVENGAEVVLVAVEDCKDNRGDAENGADLDDGD